MNCQDALSKQRNDTGTPPATLLCEYLTGYKIKWADNDTKMTIQNVRLHLRILRRLSMAVVDETAPSYQDSALFFFDRNEELWGRKSSEVLLQENTRSLDTFQAALPNLQDLRTASECLHILLLRKANIKLVGRGIADLAKGLALYNRIPEALVPRFPKYKDLLSDFSCFRNFHQKYPFGRDFNGTEIEDTAELPVFAAESLEKLTSEILIPVFMGKKHSSLLGGGAALGVGFVKAILPDLELLYNQECASDSMRVNAHSATATQVQGDSDMATPVTQEEAKELESLYQKKKQIELNNMATEFLNKNGFMLLWGQKVVDDLSAHALLKDGAAKLFMWNAGLDATKDPPGKMSCYRMKASADEERMTQAVDISARLLGEPDAAIFISGKNGLIAKDLKKTLQQCKPKLGVHELFMEPDEGAYLQAVHGENRASVGSIDPKDVYFHVIKNPSKWKDRKPTVRRFVPGNTAFKSMSGLPILQKHAMLKAPAKERKAIFRGVMGSDKWTPGLKKAAKGCDSESEEVVPMEDESDDAANGDVDGNVILFFMELHPKVHMHSVKWPVESGQLKIIFRNLVCLCFQPALALLCAQFPGRSARRCCGRIMQECLWTFPLAAA